VNDAPVAAADEYALAEDTTLSIAAPGVLANDTDVDSPALTVTSHDTPAHGTVTVAADGSFTYVPAPNYHGSDSFTYVVSDGSLSATGTVYLSITPVNDAPVADDDSYSVAEDGTLSVGAPGVLNNDSDVDGDPLTLSLVSGPAQGSLSFAGDGSFSYVPAANFNGTDSFVYRLSDGALSDDATVTLTVDSVNDAPDAINDSYTTSEDATLSVAAPGVLGNDVDVDGDALSATVVSLPANGSLSLSPSGGFVYVPNANFHGTDSFVYRASDGALTDDATVTITVQAENQAPVANKNSYTTTVDTSLTVSAPGVLGNDTDPNGDALTAILFSNPQHGSLTLNPNGSFTYVPNAGFTGVDSFLYRAYDGALYSNITSVTIRVNGLIPLASFASFSTASSGSPLGGTETGSGPAATDALFSSLDADLLLLADAIASELAGKRASG